MLWVWFVQLDSFGQQLWMLIAAPGFMLACCLLLAMLIGSWLLLRFTRLGKAHLVTKCAVLSLIAHSLFAIYAWRTYFNLPGEMGRGSGAMTVRLVDHNEAESTLKETAEEPPTWEAFTPLDSLPDIEPLERPLEQPELEISRVFEQPAEAEAADADLAEPLAALPKLENPVLAVPELLPAPPKPAESSVAAEAVIEPSADESNPQGSEPAKEIAAAEKPNDGATTQEPLSESPTPEQPLPEEPASEQLATEFTPGDEPLSSPAEAKGMLPELPPPPAIEIANSQAQPAEPAAGLVPLQVPAQLASGLNAARANPASRAAPVEYAERGPERRAAAVAARGGSEQTEQAVAAGLAWLARQQSADGRWDPRLTEGGVERLELGQDRRGAGLRSDNGITGLALLAFLGAGNTPAAGEYRETVSRGIDYLIRTQGQDGFLGGAALNFERTYCHGMAMLALGEALAMTGDERLKLPVQRAVAYTVNSQSRQDGGWRYQPGEAGDMSQFGWQVLALRSAAFGGVATPPGTQDGMRRFLAASTKGTARGLGAYRPGEGPSPTMTAEALLCRHLIEPQVDARTIDEAANYLLQSTPSDREVNEYYWYYGTLALYHVGGRPWQLWNQRLTEVLLRRQISAGPDAGAWPADGMWAGYGGRVFSTALSTLCLEVYYRYLPIYEQK